MQTGARLVELDDSNSDVVELVPDGVATVRLDYLERNVVTATVTSNAFSFTPPQRLVKDVQRRLRPLRRELIQELRKQRHHPHATPVRRGIVRRERAIRDELRPRSVEWIGANGQIVRSFQPQGESSGGGALSNIITIS
jgi:hypothetical protein